MENPWLKIVKLKEDKPAPKILKKSFFEKYNSILVERKEVIPKSFFKQNINTRSIGALFNRKVLYPRLSEQDYNSNIHNLRTPRVDKGSARKSRNNTFYSPSFGTNSRVSCSHNNP
jgi:hypothetical protein